MHRISRKASVCFHWEQAGEIFNHSSSWEAGSLVVVRGMCVCVCVCACTRVRVCATYIRSAELSKTRHLPYMLSLGWVSTAKIL